MQVDKDIDLMVANARCGACIIHVGDAHEVIHGLLDPLAQVRAILAAPAETVDLEAFPIDQLEQLHGQQRHRMQAEVRGQETDAQLLVPIALGLRQGRNANIDPRPDEVQRGRQLQAGVVTAGEQGQRRGGLEQVAVGHPRRWLIDWPDALFLPQVHPVLDDLGLPRVGLQAGMQDGFGRLQLAGFLQQAAEAVASHQVQLTALLGVDQALVEHRLPGGQGLLGLLLALQQRAQVEPGLGEFGILGNSGAIGIFRSLELPQLGQRGAQVELDDVVDRGMAMLQPALV
ncbi:hypothetical protein D3C79_714630 [compost metagenome]